MKAEMLAAGANGLRDVFRLGGRQHEYNMARWLFQSFQQRVKSRIRDLMRFIENVNLKAIARRSVPGSFPQFTNLVDATVGGGIDFDHIYGVSGANLGA